MNDLHRINRRSFLASSCACAMTPMWISGCSHEMPNEHLCSFGGITFRGMHSLSDASPEAKAAVGWISTLVGLPPNYEVKRAKFEQSPIAFASIRGQRRLLVYDEDVLFAQSGRLSWHDIKVFSHEVAHHLAGHTAGVNGSAWAHELDADYFAGTIMGKMGASRKHLGEAVGRFGPGGTTHPPADKRIKAVTDGWRKGRQSWLASGNAMHRLDLDKY